jgi:chemotaxis-related protein WspD
MHRWSERPVTLESCWRDIGVGGDRSCGELQQHVHCRNCPVFAQAATHLLERGLPDGYAQDAAQELLRPRATQQPDAKVFVFRLGQEWLGIELACIQEIASTRPVHRIAHRGGLVAGLVNIRGQLLLTVRLADLLELPAAAPPRQGDMGGRIVVMARSAETWAFAADEVEGVVALTSGDMALPPAAMAPEHAAITRGTIPWGERRLTLLASAPLFELMHRRIAA